MGVYLAATTHIQFPKEGRWKGGELLENFIRRKRERGEAERQCEIVEVRDWWRNFLGQ